MVDFTDPSWSEVDALNNGASPNGLATGALPSTIGPTVRALRAAATRLFRRSMTPFYVTTGTATAYALTFALAPTAGYTLADRYAFRPNVTNSGAATININGLGPKTITAADGSALAGGEMVAGQMVEVWYDGSNFRIIGSPVGKNPSFTTITATASGTIAGGTVWHSNNDGVGSTLDADLLDGQQGAWYQSRANHTGMQDPSTITGLTGLLAAAAPTGSVIYMATATAPAGYLKANGAAVSRTTYADLFAAIGTRFGTGDGSTTFNLPDLRGEFVRGFDDGRGIDSGRTLGSWQDGQNLAHTHTGTATSAGAHTHTITDPGHDHTYTRGGVLTTNNVDSSQGTKYPYASGSAATTTDTTGITINSGGAHTHTLSIDSSGGTEARPRNVALLACIKT